MFFIYKFTKQTSFKLVIIIQIAECFYNYKFWLERPHLPMRVSVAFFRKEAQSIVWSKTLVDDNALNATSTLLHEVAKEADPLSVKVSPDIKCHSSLNAPRNCLGLCIVAYFLLYLLNNGSTSVIK